MLIYYYNLWNKKMKKILTLALTFLTISTISAEYTAKIPLEQDQGGSLPKGSIIINNGNSGNVVVEQCRGNALLTTTTFDTSGNQYFSFSFSERYSNGVYSRVYYSSPVQNGNYSDSLTSTHRYSIQNLQYTQAYAYPAPYPPENDTAFLSNELYSICKEEIIGGSYGPKICCDFYYPTP